MTSESDIDNEDSFVRNKGLNLDLRKVPPISSSLRRVGGLSLERVARMEADADEPIYPYLYPRQRRPSGDDED